MQYRSFKAARIFVKSLKLKNYWEWAKYCKSNKKPHDIPSVPRSVYPKDWKGLGDWLGTGTVAPQNKFFRTFQEARRYVRFLKLKNYKQWLEYSKSDKRPSDIPSNPSLTYRNEWRDFGDWLGTGNIAPYKRKFRSFNEARRYARSQQLKSFTEWREFYKSKKIPLDIPTTPYRTYKNKGWKGWGDWLGTGNVASYNRKFLSFNEAKKYVSSLELKSYTEWFQYVRSGNKPDFIPIDPSQTYRKEWASWKNWLSREY